MTYTGIRVSALYKFNDDWSVLLAQSYQNMEADGLFTQYPIGSDGPGAGALAGHSVSPAVDKDKFENTSWTVNGKIGDSQVRLHRRISRPPRRSDERLLELRAQCLRLLLQLQRRTGGGGFGAGGSPGAGVPPGGTPPICYSPITSWHDKVTNTHDSHEIRLSTPDDWRTRGILGAYWEDFEIIDDMNFLYKTIPSCNAENLANALAGGYPCVGNVGPLPGTTASDPGVRNDNTAFGEEVQSRLQADRGLHARSTSTSSRRCSP